MTAKPRKDKKGDRWQTHVYLTDDVMKHLLQVAESQCRSATAQIEFFVRCGLAEHDHGKQKE